MARLDQKWRCKRCRTRLPEEKGDACPRCHAILAEVGITNPMMDWAEIRRGGPTRFIGGMVLMFGIGFFLTVVTMNAIESDPPRTSAYVIKTVGGALQGILLGWILWRTNEAEFKAAGYRGDDGFDHRD